MAVVQIPNLPLAISLVGNEQLEIVQSGVSCRTSVQAVSSFTNPKPEANYATTYQFMLALSAYGVDPNLLFQALAADFSNPATVQFYCSPYVRPGSPLAVLCQSVYVGINMTQVYSLATLEVQWG